MLNVSLMKNIAVKRIGDTILILNIMVKNTKAVI